ncbi:zinc ribbon domain-containing protein [Streptomyces iconiensis]|uniref:Zinc ribbon domain-containing protein n=1 Tax=Streptomyces iconiensis TaxID=1384038 RepID=A0ABT6ZU49_9ACTN|nr:zinc ribbon domain-containing protein [Streptomyces iconiensis]MDJ1132584.1 zinc ribbon domain-containing protein [Streptomyces iconiensis]
MIIFGTSSKLIQLAMLNLLCGFCGNPSAHGLRKRVTKFTLFFIPLFPVAPAKYSMQCTFCGAESQLTKENAEQMLAQGTAPGAPAPQQGMPQQGIPQQQGPQSGNPFAGGQQPQNPYQS